MEEYKKEIPTKELKLDNGDTVVFYTYLTTGESRQMQKKTLDSGTFNPDTGKIESLSVSTMLEVQDMSAGFLIKEIKRKDGTTVGYTKEWLDNLPNKIGNAVYEEITKLTRVSELDKEEKKSIS